VSWRFQTQAVATMINENGTQLVLSMAGQTLTAKIMTPNLSWNIYPYYLEPPCYTAPDLLVAEIELPISPVINVAVQFK